MKVSRRRIARRATVGLVTALVSLSGVTPASAAGVSASSSPSWSPWAPCSNKPAQNCADVRAVAERPGGGVFLAGKFTELRRGSERRAAQNLAALDAAGNPVAGFATHTFNGYVRSLTTEGNSLFVGGNFTSVDGKGARRLVKLDATTGAREPFPNHAVNGPVYAVEAAGGRLYLGGRFTSVAGAPRNSAAALDAGTGAVTPWNPDVRIIANDARPNDAKHNNMPVRDIVADLPRGRVYIAGDMDLLGGAARPAIGAVDPATGARVTAFNPPSAVNKSFQGMQIALANSAGQTPGVILAAGGLTNKAWRLNLNGGTVWSANTDGDVQAAAVSGSTVYLGGHFTRVCGNCYDSNTADDVPRAFLASFTYDGSGVRSPESGWAPALGGPRSPYYYGVWTLQAHGGHLYAGGVFSGTSTVTGKIAHFAP